MKDLITLFSKPIFQSEINIDNLDLKNINWIKNYQNWISDDQKILEKAEFTTLKENIQSVINEYFYGIMRAQSYIEISITESWFNKTDQGQSHHRHWHPNSVLSGIVYLTGDTETGLTRFITSQYETIEYDIVEANIFNSRTWGIRPENGSIVLFPSNVEHFVEEYKGIEPRISLSFNTFVSGTINKNPLTKLNIDKLK